MGAKVIILELSSPVRFHLSAPFLKESMFVYKCLTTKKYVKFKSYSAATLVDEPYFASIYKTEDKAKTAKKGQIRLWISSNETKMKDYEIVEIKVSWKEV